MKKLLLLFTAAFLFITINVSGQACPGGMLTNAAFTSGMASWSQYGTVTTATVLSGGSGCLNNYLTLQATNNSNVAVSQPVTFKKDSCYKVCYCVEFPFIGALYNAKLTIAAITPGITVSQLLSGSFTPAQAQIIEVVTATNGMQAANRCAPTFMATGNFTDFVIVNETIGALGTDVSIDNVCLQRDACPSSCPTANLVPGFTYTQGPGLTANFTNTTTVNAGFTMSYSWDFGDPGSGPLNTSTLTNPTHTYPAPAVYIVCLYAKATDPNGFICLDTFCIDVIIQPVGVNEYPVTDISLYPNPANNVLYFKGTATPTNLMLVNMYGQTVLNNTVQGTTVTLPADLTAGVYWAVIETNKGRALKKLVISR